MKKIPSRAPLNIVPFIDIMLVLLCIVLSISTFIAQGKIEVNLPSSASRAEPENSKIFRLEVNAAGDFYFEGTTASVETLKAEISKLRREDHLQLRIDEAARFERFIEILDVLKELDHENFSIATLQK